ncbi:MAG: hypothetical protein IT445_19845 [Phycisphaeraceae bacterium]|nr:hypothetical protein [Phycisphaeraceae bacterium]
MRDLTHSQVCLVVLALTFVATTGRTDEATLSSIRADGVLMVDSEPVFPIGLRTEKLDSLDRIADAGFNLVLGSGEWRPDHYKKAADRKLLILGGHYEWATFASYRNNNGIDLTLEEKAALQNVQRVARDQGGRTQREVLTEFDPLPGVIGWNTNEEPEAKLIELSEYAYEIFKSHNPRHIVASLASGETARWFHLFDRTCDVLIVDVYPFTGLGRRHGSLLETYTRVKKAVDELDGKPVWLMSQMIPPSYWSRNPEDDISLRDTRLQHYLGLIAGAKGVIMYQWATLLEAYGPEGTAVVGQQVFDKRWRVVSQMVEELHELGPLVVEGRVTDDLEFRWISPGKDGSGPQLIRELDVKGRKYVFVANILDQPIEAIVYGINGGNRDGYTGDVHLGGSNLQIGPVSKYDAPAVAVITVGPRGCGVFAFDRIPLPAPE